MNEEVKCKYGGPGPRCGENCPLDKCTLTPSNPPKFFPVAVMVNNGDGTATNHINGDTLDSNGDKVESETRLHDDT